MVTDGVANGRHPGEVQSRGRHTGRKSTCSFVRQESGRRSPRIPRADNDRSRFSRPVMRKTSCAATNIGEDYASDQAPDETVIHILPNGAHRLSVAELYSLSLSRAALQRSLMLCTGFEREWEGGACLRVYKNTRYILHIRSILCCSNLMHPNWFVFRRIL